MSNCSQDHVVSKPKIFSIWTFTENICKITREMGVGKQEKDTKIYPWNTSLPCPWPLLRRTTFSAPARRSSADVSVPPIWRLLCRPVDSGWWCRALSESFNACSTYYTAKVGKSQINMCKDTKFFPKQMRRVFNLRKKICRERGIYLFLHRQS